MPRRRAGQSLLVVDLESRGGARGVLEWRARRMARRLGAGVGRGDRAPQVLLHLPDGSGPIAQWPGGVGVTPTLDRLLPSRLQEIQERVFASSLDMVRGATGSVFPVVCGVSLGQLSLTIIQRYLASFSVLSAALAELLDAGEVGACHIVTADVGFARALERQVAGRAKTVSTWPPWRLLVAARQATSALSALRPRDHRKAEQAARDAMAAVLRAHGLARERPRVLVASGSGPMAQMFSVVESALARVGLGPVVRLDSSGASVRVEENGAVACQCGTPGSLGLKAGLLRAHWAEAKRQLRRSDAGGVFDGPQEALLLDGLVGRLYDSTFDAQARHVWAADTALELLQPEVVVVGNDRYWAGQAWVQLARRRGIPSVCVQDGWAGDFAHWWWLAADRLAATSEHLVRMLVHHGVPPERCTVTGQPRYDFVTRLGPGEQRAARVAVGLDPSTFAVLFAVQSDHGLDYVRGVVSALLAVPDIHIMLRPHPSDRRDVHERLMREHDSERMTLHRGGDSLTLLRACDALVTRNSTVVLEAALLGKPVITVDFGGLHNGTPFVAAGIATAVRGLEELTREVERLVSNGHARTPEPSGCRQAALDALLGPVDGRAGERVANLVAEVLQRAPSPVPAAATQLECCREGGVTA